MTHLLQFLFCFFALSPLLGCGDDRSVPRDGGVDADVSDAGPVPTVPGPENWLAPSSLGLPAGAQPYLQQQSDGTVLKIGGDDNSDGLIYSQETYDSDSREWTRIEDFSDTNIPTASPPIGLPDGSLLMVGGSRFTLERRLPADLSWGNTFVIRPAGNVEELATMAQPRTFHASQLGQPDVVLVTGGAIIPMRGEPFTTVASTELYTVSADAWAGGPDMSVPRFQHAAVKLPGGDVLILGGRDHDDRFHASVERYRLTEGDLRPTAPMQTGRAAFAAALLPSGRVLVAGGHTGPDTVTDSVELYDPDSDTWEPGPPLPQPLAFAGLAVLPNGEPLLVGGYETFPLPSGRAIVFDEEANGWASMMDLAQPRIAPGVIVLSTRRVLVVGGLREFNGFPVEIDSSEESDGAFDL